MRGVSTAWPSRLLAAALALVLTVTSVFVAYAHAAGHQPPHTNPVVSLADHDRVDAAVVAASDCGQVHGAVDCGNDEGQPGTLDHCDTICHGKQAILAGLLVVPESLPAGPSIEPTAAVRGAQPDALDRPPKPFPSA